MGKFETNARIVTGSLMLVSLVILVIAAVYRLLNPAPLAAGGGVIAGIVILVLIIATSIYFWVRNYRIALKEPSPLMVSRWRLFRMKAFFKPRGTRNPGPRDPLRRLPLGGIHRPGCLIFRYRFSPLGPGTG